jgi:NitT/TauT family transport system substrate-binding protein/sulfonate transport system substrate-binding protein
MKSLLVSAVVLAVTSGAVAAQDMLPIRIGAAGAVDHAPVFAGVERGIFAEHGLDADVVMYQSGVDMVNGLLNGAQEVNVMGSVPYLTGLARGFPLVLIGHLHGDPNRDSYSDNQSIIASAGSGVAAGDIAALEGKRIGLPRGTGAEGFLLGVLGSIDLGEDDVELINVPPAELVTALNQGDVDAVAIWQPWGATAVTQVEGAVLVQAGGCPQCYDPGTILTTEDQVSDNAETLERFMAAFAESQAWVRANNDAAAEINMRWIQGVELETMALALDSVSLDPRISSYTSDMYQAKTLPFLMGLGRIDEAFDPSSAIDTRFLAAAEESNPEAFADLAPIPADRQAY